MNFCTSYGPFLEETELLYFLLLISFIEALDVNYYGIGRPQEVVLGRTHSRVIVDVETQLFFVVTGQPVLGCE